MANFTEAQLAQAMKIAIAKLGTREWAEWANDMAPKCCRWQIIRDDGFDFAEVGSLASTFVKVKTLEVLEGKETIEILMPQPLASETYKDPMSPKD